MVRKNNTVNRVVRKVEKMDKSKKRITPYEKEVLEALWENEKPLTAREIVYYCVNKSWKPSYINIMIKSLLEKELIREAGFKRSGKNFARMFEPTMTEGEWVVHHLIEKKINKGKLLREVLSQLLENIQDVEKVEQLSILINNRKRELSKMIIKHP